MVYPSPEQWRRSPLPAPVAGRTLDDNRTTGEQINRIGERGLTPAQRAFMLRAVKAVERLTFSTRVYRIIGAFFLFEAALSVVMVVLSLTSGMNAFALPDILSR